MSLAIFTSSDVTPQLREQWENLWRQSSQAHCCNGPYWLEACQRTTPQTSFLIISCYRDEKLVGIMPLMRAKMFGVTVLQNPGANHAAKCTALVVDNDPEVIRQLVREAARHGHLVMREISESLRAALSGTDLDKSTRSVSVSWIASLADDVLHNLSHHDRKRITQTITRTGSSLQFSLYTGDVSSYLNTVIRIERLSSKARYGRDIFSDVRTRRLYQSLMQQADGENILAVLQYQDQPIAYNYGIVTRDTMLGIHMAYDAAFKKLIPGKVLIYLLFEALKKRGIRFVDLGRGEGQLKHEFAERQLYQYEVAAFSSVGVEKYFKFMRLIREKAWEGLPERWKRYPRLAMRKMISLATPKV